MSDRDIDSLIADLGSASYDARTEATRRLCAVGLPARDRLQQAAEGPDMEVALRAKNLLSVLDRIFFVGVEVGMSFSPTDIAWDTSSDLRITLHNRSAYPARVPFDVDAARRTEPTSQLSTDARQVGDLLDAADLLTVRGPDGEPVELRVDDILADAQVETAVRERLQGGPIGVIDAGGSMTLTFAAFNRGWARYPLLDCGRYEVVLEYVPPWEDEFLRTERVGRVVSNRAAITVTEGAPPGVSRYGEEAAITVREEEKVLVAMLVNRTDQSVWVNTNYGSVAPFAEGRWVYTSNASRFEIPVPAARRAEWSDFNAANLVEVAAGGSVELTRGETDTIRAALVDAGADPSNTLGSIHFSYANPCNRQWQERERELLSSDPDVPRVLREPLPRRMLSARQTSNRVRVVPAE